MKRSHLAYLGLLFCIFLILFLSVRESPETETAKSKNALKNEITGFIERHYLYPVDARRLRTAVLEEFAAGSNTILDEYSGLEEPKRHERSVSWGHYGGIGANFLEIDGEIFVVTAYPGKPAEKAGLRAGDRIISMQQEGAKGWRTNHKNLLGDFIDSMRGEEKSRVTVTLERNGALQSFSIERAVVRYQTVEKKVLDDRIGYVRISAFAADSSNNFLEALQFFKKKRADKGLILDLRNNVGGLERGALETVWPFLTDPDAIVLTKQFKDKEEVVHVREIPDSMASESAIIGFQSKFSKSFGAWAHVPVVILLNKKSSSASEIVADILHESKKAVIVGEASYGKNLEQRIFPLSNGMYLRLTVCRILYGERKHDIHKKGISPDIPAVWRKGGTQGDMEFTAEYLKNFGDLQRDPQLKIALRVLRKK